jgi:hypothetical protein
VKPHSTQNATQSPSVRRRSSWIQLRRGRLTAAIYGEQPCSGAAGSR